MSSFFHLLNTGLYIQNVEQLSSHLTLIVIKVISAM